MLIKTCSLDCMRFAGGTNTSGTWLQKNSNAPWRCFAIVEFGHHVVFQSKCGRNSVPPGMLERVMRLGWVQVMWLPV